MQYPAGCQLLSPVDAHHSNMLEAGYCLSEQMFPAPLLLHLPPSPSFVRTTEANLLLLNMLTEADGGRPEDQSILNQTVIYMWLRGGP